MIDLQYENVLKLGELSKSMILQEQYKQLELQMRKEGVAYIVRLLLLLVMNTENEMMNRMMVL